MVSKSNKRNNIPYYITAFSATLLFAIAVVLIAAPAILAAFPSLAFLTPVATLALGLGTPLIAVCIAASVITAISSAIIIKNHNTIFDLESQLMGYTAKAVYKEVATAVGEAFTSTKEAFSSGRVLNILKRDILLPSVEVAPELGKAFTSTKEAFSSGRVLNILKRDILLPSVKVATEFGKAFTSTKKAFSDGRALNILKRDILLPSVKVATEFGKAGFTYTKEKLAKAYMVFTEIGGNLTEKVKAGERLSPRQVLGIGATFGFAGLLAQYFIGPVTNALSPANNSTDVDDLHNNYFPNSSYTHPNNTQAMLDNKLDQAEKMLNLSKEGAKKYFGADPGKDDFVDNEAQKKSTLIQDSGTVERYISSLKHWFFSLFISKDTAEAVIEGKVGQNDSIQAKEAVIEEKVGHNKSAFHNGCPAPGLQGIVLSHQSIAKSAPSSGP